MLFDLNSSKQDFVYARTGSETKNLIHKQEAKLDDIREKTGASQELHGGRTKISRNNCKYGASLRIYVNSSGISHNLFFNYCFMECHSPLLEVMHQFRDPTTLDKLKFQEW